MSKSVLVMAALAGASAACDAATCEAIRAQIEAKLRAGGVEHFVLDTVDAQAKVDGRVLGRCDLGTRKIVLVPGPAHASSAAARRPPAVPRDDGMLTECKDGTVVVGGDCRK